MPQAHSIELVIYSIIQQLSCSTSVPTADDIHGVNFFAHLVILLTTIDVAAGLWFQLKAGPDPIKVFQRRFTLDSATPKIL